MRELNDPRLLEHYLKHWRIESLFDTPGLPFRLYEYEPGEMLNLLHPAAGYLKFVVKGRLDIYAAYSNGSRRLIAQARPLTLLGNVEFAGGQDEAHWQEVRQTVHTVELRLEGLRATLLEDNRFLRYLLHGLAAALCQAQPERDGAATLEQIVLYHLRYERPDHTLQNVGETAFRLHYSTRQLQRVLRALTAQGLIEKRGRGRYALAEPAAQNDL